MKSYETVGLVWIPGQEDDREQNTSEIAAHTIPAASRIGNVHIGHADDIMPKQVGDDNRRLHSPPASMSVIAIYRQLRRCTAHPFSDLPAAYAFHACIPLSVAPNQ